MVYNNYISRGQTRDDQERKKKMTVTKDTVIGDILDENAEKTAPLFLELGMHCLGCPASRGETIAEACMVHGADADEFVKKLNEAIAQ